MSRKEQTIESIQTDFDRIAMLGEENWNHNSFYHEFLIGQLPERCRNALEIGCRTGLFSRLLATRAQKTRAVDLSEQMIRAAREKSKLFPNIEFACGDIMAYPLSDNYFDCIASLTTLHHLPLENVLKKIRKALKPQGVFIGLDLYQRANFQDWLFDSAAFPASLLMTMLKTRRFRPPKAVREAYAKHGKTDTYLSLSELEKIYSKILSGVKITRHLFWRYSVIWKKI